MKAYLLCLVMTVAAQDYVYLGDYKSHYKYHDVNATFEEAFKTCLGEGAQLYVGATTYENSAINARYPGKVFWTGLRRFDGKVTTEDASSSYYCRWTGAAEDCVAMTSSNYCQYTKCTERMGFVCKRGLTVHNVRCDTTDDGYVFNDKLSRCYKQQNTAVNWHDAVTKCRSEGASLVVVESNAQANHLKRTMPASWEYSHIGFNDIFVEGYFVTVDGRSMKDIPFRNFSAGQPDNQLDNEHCLVLSDVGDMYDMPCEDKYGYFCERTPIEEPNKPIVLSCPNTNSTI